MMDFLQQMHAFRLYLVALPPEELEQVQTCNKIFSAWWHKERTVRNKALSKEPWAVAQPIQQTRWADALTAAESVHSLGYNYWLVGNLSECPLLPTGNFVHAASFVHVVPPLCSHRLLTLPPVLGSPLSAFVEQLSSVGPNKRYKLSG